MGQNLNPKRLIGVDATKPGEILRRDGSFGLPPAGTLIEAVDVTVDGGANNTPSLLFRAKYDSDGTTAILNTKKDIGIRNSILSSGAYQLDFLNDVGSIIGSLTSGGEFYAGANKVWHAGNLSPSDYLLKTGGVVTGNITFNNTANSGILTGDNTQRMLIGGGSSWSSTSGAYIAIEGLDFGGAGAGGNVVISLPSGKDVYIAGNKAWHAGNDGSGSGLDADLLDGINSTQFLYGRNNSATSQHDNFDTISKSGFYDSNNSASTPTGTNAWWHGIHIEHGGLNGYSFQLAKNFAGDGDLQFRNQVGGAWNAWKKIWNSDNDGAGSGLDADLLDGLNASQFLRADTATGNDFIRVPAGNGHGIRLWNGSTSYNIQMSQAGNGTWGGSLDSSTDYNMYFTMIPGADATINNRGFVFKNGNGDGTTASTPIAHLTSNGMWAKDFILTSDVRLKENFRPIEDSLDKVNAIETFYHTWKGEMNDGKEHLGVSAQQLQKIVPELVKDGDRLHVMYPKMAPLLIAAVQELSKKVEELERRLNGA